MAPGEVSEDSTTQLAVVADGAAHVLVCEYTFTVPDVPEGAGPYSIQAGTGNPVDVTRTTCARRAQPNCGGSGSSPTG